ncbi:MAG: pentapeptide repeat-containing protein [Candidatus Aminicenantaceae bacterium]
MKDTAFNSIGGCEFKEASAFKYAKFHKKANFENTTYEEEALFKYAKFSEPLNLDGVEFERDANFKYTKIDGRSFASYLVKNKR